MQKVVRPAFGCRCSKQTNLRQLSHFWGAGCKQRSTSHKRKAGNTVFFLCFKLLAILESFCFFGCKLRNLLLGKSEGFLWLRQYPRIGRKSAASSIADARCIK